MTHPTVAELTAQQEHLNQRTAHIESELALAREDVASADAALDEAIRGELIGIATPADVANARAALDAAHEKLAQLDRLAGVAKSENARMTTRIFEAKGREDAALMARIKAASEPIEQRIRSNTKLRADLLMVYALWHQLAVDHGGYARWDLILESVFAAPTEAEHEKAFDEAQKLLGVA